MSKFQLLCSCTICKMQTTVQSLRNHLKTHLQKEQQPLCIQCSSIIQNVRKKFCNRSCAAKYNNINRSLSARTGPPKGTKPKNYHPYTKIRWCSICKKAFVPRSNGYVQTCSEECYRAILSNRIVERIIGGWNPNRNRGRGKQSYLEQSFEQWLQSNSITEYETEKHFRNLDLHKSYFVDFYFPLFGLIIELDGTQHNCPKQKELDVIRDRYITDHYGLTIVRITHNEFIKKIKIAEICSLLRITRDTV